MPKRHVAAVLIAGALVVGSPWARSDQPPDAGVGAAAVGGEEDGGLAPIDEEDIELEPGGAGSALPVGPPDPAAREAWLVERLDAAVRARPMLVPAQIGATVVDVTSGRVLWSHHADRPLNLASVTKVLTGAAALHHLGAGFRWRTSVLAEKLDPRGGVVDGDLFVRGRGDPTLTVGGLRDLAQSLAWKGITEVTGDIVFDGSYFDLIDVPPRFDDQPKERAGYRAPIGAASLERNAVTVVIVADRAGRGMAEVTLDPPLTDYVRLVDTGVATVSTGRTRVYASTRVARDHIELRVSGQILADDGVTWIRRRIDDPARMFGESFKLALAERGIRVRGRKIGRGLAPATAVLVAERESPPLSDVMRTMAKYSDNYMAETVLKTLGAETRPPPPPPATPAPATWSDGIHAVERYLSEQAGVTGTVRYENGSGLYDSTAVPAAAVAKVLVAAYRNFRVGPDLASALSTGGVDGTLRRRFRGDDLRARVRAKTGTLANVSTLAGYAGVDGARPLAFAVLVNALPAGTHAEARALQDAIATLCVAYTSP